MRHLFQHAGRAALMEVLGARPLLAFDFDGTLAPIVARPDEARVARAVSDRLAQLTTLRPVAVITGRSVEDVAPRLGFVPQYIVGNHGAEDPEESRQFDMSALETFRRQLAVNADQMRSAGIEVEDK